MAKEKTKKADKKAPAAQAKTAGISIRWKLILIIVPVVFVLLVALAMITTSISRSVITETSDERMEATLGEYTKSIGGQLDQIKNSARVLAKTVAATYMDTDMDDYAAICKGIAADNDMVLGSGIWFEPYVYDKAEVYMGPYWYKDVLEDGTWETMIETWDYSNEEYDYFSQEYYLNSKNQDGMDAVITDPYYDETSGMVMASCSAPIKGYDGHFLGCVTVDIMLTSVQEELDQVSVGDSGTLWLIAGDGLYIYHPAFENAAADGMTVDDSTEMGSYVEKIKTNATGEGSFQWDGVTRLLFWDTVPGMNWKMGLTMKQDEVLEGVNRMMQASVIILIIAIVVSTLLIVWQAGSIAKVMVKVRDFAKELSAGNFAVKKLNIKRKDEIGEMAGALNVMYENNSGVIRNIGVGSGKVNTSSSVLSDTATDLTSRFEEITANMERVNDAMSNTGAATEQVSASANEVNESVQKLAEETARTKQEALSIVSRAAEIEKDGRAANEYAIKVAKERGEELNEAAKQAEVVQQIGTLADSIADIAGQINLLSLNASIEAARAGEHGRGFAVVASEINSLATETRTAVEGIQETVSGIQAAFSMLEKSAMALLNFVQETVTPDYGRFTDIGRQYGEDAKMFGELADSISDMVSYISESMEQVNAAVASIAESATETATSSSDVTNTMSEVEGMVEKVSGMAGEQLGVAENLDGIVKQFRFDDDTE